MVWKLEMFKGKEDGFHLWRETFELQAVSIWLGIDRLFENLRGETLVSDRKAYDTSQAILKINTGPSLIPM